MCIRDRQHPAGRRDQVPQAKRRDRERKAGHNGDQWDVPPGQPLEQRVGRRGAVHGLPAARLREQAGRASASWRLGPRRLHAGR
eukprot:5549832-Pyramimonas_sp.AAC.1